MADINKGQSNYSQKGSCNRSSDHSKPRIVEAKRTGTGPGRKA